MRSGYNDDDDGTPLILVMCAIVLLASISVNTAIQHIPQPRALPLPAAAAALHPAALQFSASGAQEGPALASVATPNYDEQIGATFTQDVAALTYNVTAVAQTDSDGYGPAYILNGLTSAGYWYQVGLSWHWPNTNG
jgi:hypothetical protein